MNDRVLLTVCGSELQARVLISQLEGRGIPAAPEPVGGANPLEKERRRIMVPSDRLEEARQVLERLEGKSSFGGLLDIRRLLVAVAVLALLIAVIVFLVDLVL